MTTTVPTNIPDVQGYSRTSPQPDELRSVLRMNARGIDRWSDDHIGSLGLVRTVVGFLNLIVAVIIMVKVFGWV